MASRDDLDPLGTDWEQRAKRGIAVMREKAYEEASGSSIPIEPLTRILADLSGRVSGVLGSIPERIRDFGGTQEMVDFALEIVCDCQIQISVALDKAVDEAMGDVDAIESALDSQEPTEGNDDPIRGPKERKSLGHKGKPTVGNVKTKAGRK